MSAIRAANSTRYFLRAKNIQGILRTSHFPLKGYCAFRKVHSNGSQLAFSDAAGLPKFWADFKNSIIAPKPTFEFLENIQRSILGTEITAVGFLGERRDVGRLCFVSLKGGSNLHRIQVVSQSKFSEQAQEALKEIPARSAVSVTGVLNLKNTGRKISENGSDLVDGEEVPLEQLEIQLKSITCLNIFPQDLVPLPNQVHGIEDRHLQIRFDDQLRKRLQFRSKVADFARKQFSDFQEVETPLLFKSTPEGAREFLVPTRLKGHAYGLPQSPQQYKQILMSSGINKYIQFAKCFRDEDYRADRQPEFTQIDLEMAWSDGEDVMNRVEQFIKNLWANFASPGTTIETPLPTSQFRRIKYQDAMSYYGSDKPDLRIKGQIHRVDHIIPANLVTMLTSIQDPIIDAWKIRLNGSPSETQKFIAAFLDSSEGDFFNKNVVGGPGVFVFNSQRPLEGLQAFGFEGADKLKRLYAKAAELETATDTEFEDGDLLFLQARENVPHTGGSTPFGLLRLAIQKAAIKEGLITPDHSHLFLWITDFPLFTLDSGIDLGQEGNSGFSATHHPFTAPKTAEDVDMLLNDPLKVVAEHYDLVLNGVELGGGSRRIHNAEVQKFILEKIIKLDAERMESFSHLYRALRAGCPPHAGLAIGFDRLVAMMQGRDSVRDVIAFPKDKNGRDLMVKSPNKITDKQLEQYHLQERPGKI